MQLVCIDIMGFRGISRLSLNFDQLTTLIGENTWGKSSLLDALSLALSPTAVLYQFNPHDFYMSDNDKKKDTYLQIVLQLQESFPYEHQHNRYRRLKPLFTAEKYGSSELQGQKSTLKSIYYSLSADLDAKNKVNTTYRFLDSHGEVIPNINVAEFARLIMSLHPIVRMRDSRRLRDEHLINKEGAYKEKQQDRLEKRLNNTYNRLITEPEQVNKGELKSSMDAVAHIMTHYFAFAPHNRQERQTNTSGVPLSLSHLLLEKVTKENQLVFMGLVNSYIRSLGEVVLKPSSRPILIFEDPEARLHPILLKQLLAFLEAMPMQKIMTTNSSELLAKVAIHSLRRCLRFNDKIAVYHVKQSVFSQSERRLVDFHIHKTHANVLFARAWLFVEGETEIWMFNELAKIMGYDLSTEGVELIQFAQSGLKPLIKLAKSLGIEWHMIADGDMAGEKYRSTAESMLDGDLKEHRVTILPERDIEHFLYKNGYKDLFIDMARLNPNEPINPNRLIQKAIKHYSKPDMALKIVHYTEERGASYIPVLFRMLIKRLLSMAKGPI